jgi:hypothetical protein
MRSSVSGAEVTGDAAAGEVGSMVVRLGAPALGNGVPVALGDRSLTQ